MKLTITLFLLAMSFVAFSQTIIKGTITDDIGLLSGANIVVKNSRFGVVSNAEGYFEIQARNVDTLLVSYLGYDTKEVVIANKKEIHLRLEGSMALDEVEIVAYATPRCFYKLRCGIGSVKVTYNNFKSDILTEMLFPNPSKNGVFQLNFLKTSKKIQIQVHDISGQLIKRLSYQNVNNKVNIYLSQHPVGIYIINIIADGKRLSPKKAIRG